MVLDRILGSADEFSLRHRFFNAASLCMAATVVMIVATEYTMPMPPLFYLCTILVTGAFTVLYALSRFYGQHRRLNWPFALLCYLVVVYDWYLGGGYSGTVPQVALAMTMAVFVIMPGRQKIVAVLLMALLAIWLFSFELWVPGGMALKVSQHQYIRDEMFTALIAATVLIVLVSIVVRGYNQEHDMAVSVNQKLTEANHRLRQMQFDLEFNNARYVGIFEQMSSGVVVYQAVDQGEDFVIVEFNSAAESIEGVRRENMLGQKLSEAFPGAEAFGITAVLRRVWSTGRPEPHPEAFYKDKRISGWRDNYVYKLPSGEVVTIYRDITKSKQLEDELRWNEERFRNLFHDSPNANFLIQGDRYVDCNQASIDLLGLENREKVIGYRFWEVSPSAQAGGLPAPDYARQHVDLVLEKGSHRFEWVHRVAGGREIFVEVLMTRIDHRGDTLLHSTWNDISKRREAENALKDREIRYRTLFESSSDAIMLVDEDITVISANQAMLKMFEYESVEQLMGMSPADLSPERQPNGEFSAAEARWMVELALHHGGHEFEWLHRRSSGEVFYANVRLAPMVLNGKQVLQSSVRDITETKRIERQLRELATTDPLTGANNRRKFMDHSAQELSRSNRYGSALSILLLDIDRFKAVNDTYGHDAGDEVLKSVVQVCHSSLRETDIFGRLGGEEFGALLIEADPDTALATAERLRRALAENLVSVRDATIGCTVSIGITSLGPGEHDLTLDDLIKRADMALYQAKADGRNCVRTI